MKAFERFIRDWSNGSWTILFAKSSIDTVSKTYGEMVGGEIEKNIAVDFVVNNSEEQWQPDGTIVQVVDSDWTIIFHRIGIDDDFNAKLLSKKLSAKVLLFWGADSVGLSGCSLFDPDIKEQIDYATAEESESLDEFYEEAMEYAEEEDLDDFPQLVNRSNIISSYDDLFDSLGIKPVGLCLNKSRDRAIVEDKQVQIERVDVLKDIFYN